MSAVDPLRTGHNRILVAPVDPSLPLGIHQPKRDGDVGWDLECMEDTTIGPMQSADVPVNVRLAFPPGFYADIRNRSSMARRGLYVDQNVIDTGYRGRLFVFIRNMALPLPQWNGSYGSWSTEYGNITLKAGERIGQLIFHRVHPAWLSVCAVDEIPLNTERGEGGFGSTGR